MRGRPGQRLTSEIPAIADIAQTSRNVRGRHGPDLSGKARTADVTAAVIDAIHGANA